MSRRRRSLLFSLFALLAAGAAAAIADDYGSRVADGYGRLRPVVVLAADLPARAPIGPEQADAALTVRRAPQRFVPAGALSSPLQALGMAPRGPLAAGSYLLASQLGPPRRRGGHTGGLGGDRRPVEIAVSGAGALIGSAAVGGRQRVDVVVTTEPRGSGPGRTYVAAPAVPLLALRAGAEGPGGLAAATLGLTRRQALRLIAAESFARRVTLLAAG